MYNEYDDLEDFKMHVGNSRELSPGLELFHIKRFFFIEKKLRFHNKFLSQL